MEGLLPAAPHIQTADGLAVQTDRKVLGGMAQQLAAVTLAHALQQNSAVQRSKDTVHIGALFKGKADAVAQSHLGDALADAAGTHCPTGYTVPSAMRSRTVSSMVRRLSKSGRPFSSVLGANR